MCTHSIHRRKQFSSRGLLCSGAATSLHLSHVAREYLNFCPGVEPLFSSFPFALLAWGRRTSANESSFNQGPSKP